MRSLLYEHMFAKLAALTVLIAAIVGLAARPSGSAGRPVGYVVKPTDTLWSIATSHYGGDPREAVWKLEQRNRLAGSVLLRPGEHLVLPP